MEQLVEVVDHQQVDRAEAEALQAVLVGAHDAVVAVVEVQRERQRVAPVLLVEQVGPGGGAQHAAHLGRHLELFAGAPAQEFAEAMFAFAVAVEWRGVVVADAGVPGALHHLPGGRVADRAEQVADRRAAETEPGEFDAGAPQGCRLHVLPNHGETQLVHRGSAPPGPAARDETCWTECGDAGSRDRLLRVRVRSSAATSRSLTGDRSSPPVTSKGRRAVPSVAGRAGHSSRRAER